VVGYRCIYREVTSMVLADDEVRDLCTNMEFRHGTLGVGKAFLLEFRDTTLRLEARIKDFCV
jgi:hypothetical protein